MTQRELCAVIAANCRQARLKLKLSQAELAKLAGTSQDQISRFEGGNTAPTLQSLINLAEALRITPAALLTPAPVASVPAGRRQPKLATAAH